MLAIIAISILAI